MGHDSDSNSDSDNVAPAESGMIHDYSEEADQSQASPDQMMRCATTTTPRPQVTRPAMARSATPFNDHPCLAKGKTWIIATNCLQTNLCSCFSFSLHWNQPFGIPAVLLLYLQNPLLSSNSWNEFGPLCCCLNFKGTHLGNHSLHRPWFTVLSTPIYLAIVPNSLATVCVWVDGFVCLQPETSDIVWLPLWSSI